MGTAPEVDDIRQQEQGGENGDDGDDDGGTGMFDGDGGMPSFGLSRTHLLLIGLVVVALLAWKLRDSGDSDDSGSSGTKAREAVEEMRDPDLGDVTVTEEEGQDEVEVVVPADPDNELDKDEAVVAHLKEAGHFGGDGE